MERGLFDFGGGQGANLVLNSAIGNNKFSHAYLFCGSDFFGVKAVARRFAMAVFCEKKSGVSPCFKCDSCTKFLSQNHADYFEFGVDDYFEKSTLSVAEARKLSFNAFLKPIEGGFKVFLLNGVSHINLSAANALLKLLEEPPKGVVFLLTACSRFEVLPTISSRCFFVNVSCSDEKNCEKVLREEFSNLDESDLKKVVVLSEGSVEKARLILQNSKWQEAMKIAIGLFSAWYKKNELNFLRFTAKIEADSGLVLMVFDLFVAALQGYVRKFEFVGCNSEKLKIFFESVKRVFDCFESAKKAVSCNCNLKLVLTQLCCSVFSM